MTYLAAESNLGGHINGIGDLGEIQYTKESAMTIFNKIISNVIGLMTIVAGLWFVIQLIIGAYGFLSAGGDEKGVEAAKKKITNAMIGLLIVVAAFAITSLFGKLLGFDILSPEAIIGSMWD